MMKRIGLVTSGGDAPGMNAAMFSMIGVSFDKNRKMGFVVTITFLILIGCLIYYLLPF
jgi:6-phosphofructokinase